MAIGVLWLVAGFGLAWIFGGAARLGGPTDLRVRDVRAFPPEDRTAVSPTEAPAITCSVSKDADPYILH